MTIRRTPLYEEHLRLQAKMSPFGGWDMPLHYGSQVAEHEAVRKAVGIFDVSHMGQVRLQGPGAQDLLQRTMTNDVMPLAIGQSCYGAMCADDGGMIDDLIATRLGADHFFVVVNASTATGDVARIEALRMRHGLASARVMDESAQWAMIAVQGPEALDLVQRVTGKSFHHVAYFHMAQAELGGAAGYVSRTGYTGEDGVELIVAPEVAVSMWRSLCDAGAKPCGLAARDTLRLEAGYLLSGQDFGIACNPLEMGLSWCTSFSKTPAFAGSEPLLALKKGGGPKRRFVGLVLHERGIPRHDMPVVALPATPCESGETAPVVGHVTSGTFSPTLQRGIAMALVEAGQEKNDRLGIRVRQSDMAAERVRPPFVKNTSLKKG